MGIHDQEIKFSIVEGSHVLRPENDLAFEAQNSLFDLLERKQKEFIKEYNNLNSDEKFKQANLLASFFVDVLMNGDQASFKALLGSGERLMNEEELKNINNDYTIAQKKKSLGEYKTFLLLDLLPYSNRRADAIIISNDYQIELYDFSEGIIAEKLKEYHGDMTDLKEGERKQLDRKSRQQERINSFQNKIKMDSSSMEDVILDNKKVNILYYCNKPKLFDFNIAYQEFLKNNRKRVYIPESLCFLMKDGENNQNDFIVFPLKKYIDHPYYSVDTRSIRQEFIDDIYKNNTKITFSKYYFFFFFDKFTCFDIVFTKRIDQYQIKLKLGKKVRGLSIKDSRTNKLIPLSYGLLFKHSFMNISLRSWCEYLSAICNQSFDNKDFNRESFYLEKVKKECPFFDV